MVLETLEPDRARRKKITWLQGLIESQRWAYKQEGGLVWPSIWQIILRLYTARRQRGNPELPLTPWGWKGPKK